VLERIAAGDDTTEIIQGLDIAYSTLATHRKRLADKCGGSTNGWYAKLYWFHRLCGVFHAEALTERQRDCAKSYLTSANNIRTGSDTPRGDGVAVVGVVEQPTDSPEAPLQLQ